MQSPWKAPASALCCAYKELSDAAITCLQTHTPLGFMQVVGQMTQNGTSKNAAAPMYSNATVVPAVTSVALLGGYSTVAAFNTSERARVGFSSCDVMHCLQILP